MDEDKIIAVALLTQGDLDLLGPTFSRLWPVEEAPGFDELIRAIDAADAEARRAGNRRVPAAAD
jgi:hypothetical protein